MTPVLSKEQRAAVRRWVALTGLCLAAVGGLLAWTVADGVNMPGSVWWPWLLAPGVGLVLGALWSWWSQLTGSSGVVERMTAKSRARDGQATRGMIRRSAGRGWARKQLEHVRPDLAAARSRWQQLRIPTRQVAARVARVGRKWLYTTQEEVTLILGGPRVGKSGTLACRILEAPGAVIATSTRADLYDKTHQLRAQAGPVYVYDPAGVAHGLQTTIAWNPLMGCGHGPTAFHRAGDLMQGTSGNQGGDSRRDYWVGLGRDALAALMHAAALGGHGMRDVQHWVATAGDPATHSRVLRLLDAGADPAYLTQARQFFENNYETRSSIQTTIMPALSWLSDPTAVATTQGPAFDVERLLAEHGTVYAIATKERAHVVPLLVALVAHIGREARRLAGGRRLVDQLTVTLDEVAVTCPIPLDSWSADMGGFNIQIAACAQGMSQLRQQYGPDGAATILNNAAVLMQFGGSKHGEDLEAVTKILGERTETQITTDADGKTTARSQRQVPVLTAAQIAQLAAGRCVVLRSGALPVLTRAPMVWQHPHVRAHTRREKVTARVNQLRSLRGRITARAVQLEATRAEKRLRRTRGSSNRQGPHSTRANLTPLPTRDQVGAEPDYHPDSHRVDDARTGEDARTGDDRDGGGYTGAA